MFSFKVVLIAIAWIGVVSLAVLIQTADAKVPPKFIKVAHRAGKAIYATKYGYSLNPLPTKILLETNISRKESHRRGRSRKPKPRTRVRRRPRRPSKYYRVPVYASKYKKYVPSRAPSNYRPKRVKPPPRPYREPDYYEQEVDDYEEPYSAYDDYEEVHPKIRGFDHEDYSDFVTKHAELYSGGYDSGKRRKVKKRPKYDDEEGAFTEDTGMYTRRPRPYIKSGPATRRPHSSKLYSATISRPRRPERPKPKREQSYSSNRQRPPKDNKRTRGRYKGPDSYETEGEYNSGERDQRWKEGSGRYRYKDDGYSVDLEFNSKERIKESYEEQPWSTASSPSTYTQPKYQGNQYTLPDYKSTPPAGIVDPTYESRYKTFNPISTQKPWEQDDFYHDRSFDENEKRKNHKDDDIGYGHGMEGSDSTSWHVYK